MFDLALEWKLREESGKKWKVIFGGPPLPSPSFGPSPPPLVKNLILSPAFPCCENQKWQLWLTEILLSTRPPKLHLCKLLASYPRNILFLSVKRIEGRGEEEGGYAHQWNLSAKSLFIQSGQSGHLNWFLVGLSTQFTITAELATGHHHEVLQSLSAQMSLLCSMFNPWVYCGLSRPYRASYICVLRRLGRVCGLSKASEHDIKTIADTGSRFRTSSKYSFFLPTLLIDQNTD